MGQWLENYNEVLILDMLTYHLHSPGSGEQMLR